MRQKYRGIIFDLDGTLIDSKVDIAVSVNETLSHLGLDTIPETDVFNFIGEGVSRLMYQSIKQSLKDEPSRLLDAGVTLFKNKYKNHLLDNTRCYNGVIETLNELDQFKKGIITNKPKEFAVKILKGLKLDKYFSTILGGDDLSHRKPHPEPFIKMLEDFGLKANEVLVVGDSFTDIEGAHESAIHGCFVSYGYGKIRSIQPHFQVDQFSDIKNLLYDKA